MQFFKSGVRRLEQGLLEGLGATTSSKDASFEADDQRCVLLSVPLPWLHWYWQNSYSTALRSCFELALRAELQEDRIDRAQSSAWPGIRTQRDTAGWHAGRVLALLFGRVVVMYATLAGVFSRSACPCRYRRLDDSLQRLNAAVLMHVASLKKSCEDSRELVSVLDFFASADLKQGVVPNSAEAVRFLDAVQSMQRVHLGIKAAVARSVETMMTERVISPLGNLLRSLPVLKRHMDARRQALTGAFAAACCAVEGSRSPCTHGSTPVHAYACAATNLRLRRASTLPSFLPSPHITALMTRRLRQLRAAPGGRARPRRGG